MNSPSTKAKVAARDLHYTLIEQFGLKDDAVTNSIVRQGLERLAGLAPEPAAVLEKVAQAYGYLWHVNNEPGTPQQYAPETAAYMARRILRDLLTSEQRGEGINAARHEISGCKVPPAGWRCTREAGHAGPCAAIPLPETKAGSES